MYEFFLIGCSIVYDKLTEINEADTYFVILEFHLQAGFEDAALIVEEADTE